jgi:hypothetical protein
MLTRELDPLGASGNHVMSGYESDFEGGLLTPKDPQHPAGAMRIGEPREEEGGVCAQGPADGQVVQQFPSPCLSVRLHSLRNAMMESLRYDNY